MEKNRNKNNALKRKKYSNWWVNLILMVGAFCCIIPFVMVVMISFSSESSVLRYGYSLWPKEWSIEGYRYLFAKPDAIFRAYGITILTTIVGTVVGLFISAMLAYVISRKDYPYRRIISFYIFFTMLFGGGLAPTYVMWTNTFHIKNTIWSMIIPGMLCGAWNIMMMRTYFSANIPDSLIESAYLDGARESRIYLQIVLPLAKPVLSAIGFMTVLNYWNAWYNSMIYITNPKLYNLSYMMTKTLLDIQTLKGIAELPAEMLAILGKMPSETVRMAMAVVGVGPMFAIFPFFQEHFVKGLTVGSVKG